MRMRRGRRRGMRREGGHTWLVDERMLPMSDNHFIKGEKLQYNNCCF